MNSTIDIENKLLELDKELHSILSILRKKEGRDVRKIVDLPAGHGTTILVVRILLIN